jgi:hypothetical protein
VQLGDQHDGVHPRRQDRVLVADEQLLHNQTALRLKGRLLFTPGVMVISVPYQLRGSELGKEREDWQLQRLRAGDVRRGRIGR